MKRYLRCDSAHEMYDSKMEVEPIMKIYSSTRSIYADENMYNGMKFDDGQIEEIRLGLESGVDVDRYADPKFDGW